MTIGAAQAQESVEGRSLPNADEFPEDFSYLDPEWCPFVSDWKEPKNVQLKEDSIMIGQQWYPIKVMDKKTRLAGSQKSNLAKVTAKCMITAAYGIGFNGESSIYACDKILNIGKREACWSNIYGRYYQALQVVTQMGISSANAMAPSCFDGEGPVVLSSCIGLFNTYRASPIVGTAVAENINSDALSRRIAELGCSEEDPNICLKKSE